MRADWKEEREGLRRRESNLWDLKSSEVVDLLGTDPILLRPGVGYKKRDLPILLRKPMLMY